MDEQLPTRIKRDPHPAVAPPFPLGGLRRLGDLPDPVLHPLDRRDRPGQRILLPARVLRRERMDGEHRLDAFALVTELDDCLQILEADIPLTGVQPGAERADALVELDVRAVTE
ncbi:hypothetical protein QP028_06870 [Corynebacterium suedekumii]|nr:hypothetical protein QP028_06870 [Corynebacterium suedekumii]